MVQTFQSQTSFRTAGQAETSFELWPLVQGPDPGPEQEASKQKRTPTRSRAVASQSQLTVDIVFGNYSGTKATRIRRSIPSTKGLLTCRVLTELICVIIVRPQSRLNKDLRALLRAPLLALLRSSASTTGLHASSMTRPRSQRAFVRNTKTKTTHRHMRTCVRACMQGRMCACVCVCVSVYSAIQALSSVCASFPVFLSRQTAVAANHG